MTTTRVVLGVVLSGLIVGPVFGQTARIGTLQQAIAQGQVVATFAGTGGSSGDSVTVTVIRTPRAGTAPLELAIPSGSILRSAGGSAQSMVVAAVRGRDVGRGMFSPGSLVVVPLAGSATYLLSAYCTEFEKENPGPADTFSLQGSDPGLACIAREAGALSVEARQAAVWMYTDHLTFATMNEKFPVSPNDWDAAAAALQRCTGR